MILIEAVVSVISIGLVMTVTCTRVHAIHDAHPAQVPLIRNVTPVLSSQHYTNVLVHVDRIVMDQVVSTEVAVTVNVMAAVDQVPKLVYHVLKTLLGTMIRFHLLMDSVFVLAHILGILVRLQELHVEKTV